MSQTFWSTFQTPPYFSFSTCIQEWLQPDYFDSSSIVDDSARRWITWPCACNVLALSFSTSFILESNFLITHFVSMIPSSTIWENYFWKLLNVGEIESTLKCKCNNFHTCVWLLKHLSCLPRSSMCQCSKKQKQIVNLLEFEEHELEEPLKLLLLFFRHQCNTRGAGCNFPWKWSFIPRDRRRLAVMMWTGWLNPSVQVYGTMSNFGVFFPDVCVAQKKKKTAL